jgi:hypothetical protein
VTASALYLLAHVLVALLGLPVLWIPEVRSWTFPARAAAAFAVGAIILAIESTVSTLVGVRWTLWFIIAPPVLLAAFLARRGATRASRPPAGGFGAGTAFAAFIGCAAICHLGLSLATARATSTDFLLFWGVKAVRFASAGSVDPVLLTSPAFVYGQPFYPPLVPVMDAWSVLLAGRMPWRGAPMTTLVWFVAAALLVLEIEWRRLGRGAAMIVTAFWMAALSASLVFSLSGANAEAPLILYETAAGMLLLTEDDDPGYSRRLLTGLFLAGAVLTKIEGSIGSALLILGTILRNPGTFRSRRGRGAFAALVLPPFCAGLLWLGFVLRFHIPSNYSGKGRLLEMHWDRLPHVSHWIIRNLRGGTHWLSWILPAVIILAGASAMRLRQALPGAVAALGLLAFLFFIYLHEPGDQAQRIRWEVPRTSQPALSLLIGVAAVCSPPERRQVRSTNIASSMV